MSEPTKDDFDLDVVEFDSGVYLSTSMDLTEAHKLAKQILDNYEDVKEMRKIQAAGFFSVKEIDELANRDVDQRAIVERLEKRIEELGKVNWGSNLSSQLIKELQKIREGKK